MGEIFLLAENRQRQTTFKAKIPKYCLPIFIDLDGEVYELILTKQNKLRLGKPEKPCAPLDKW